MISTINEAWTKCYGNTDKETIHSWYREIRDDYRVEEVYELGSVGWEVLLQAYIQREKMAGKQMEQ